VFSGGYFFFPFSFFARTQIVSEWVKNPDRLTITAGSTGYLFNVASDKCMDTDGDVAEKDAWQAFCQGNRTAQKWKLETAATGYVIVRNVRSNLCLLPTSTTDTAELTQRTCPSAANAAASTSYHWKFIARPGNSYALQSRLSSRCIDNNSSTSYFTYLKQRACDANDVGQRFLFSR
jgi:hypothetical protein